MTVPVCSQSFLPCEGYTRTESQNHKTQQDLKAIVIVTVRVITYGHLSGQYHQIVGKAYRASMT